MIVMDHPAAFFPQLIKAASPSGMAGNAADLLDLQQQGIAVAIEAQFFHVLEVPGRFALLPKCLPRARPVISRRDVT